jgi:CRP-like cAMP-binding protein
VDAELLRNCSLFGGVSDAAVERILACSAERVAEQGQVLALPNDPGSGMFVIEEGTVAVELRSGPVELGPGDFFGELALLVEDGVRVARVRATSRVRCITIPREDFLALVETEPTFALALLRELARRMVEARAAA